MNATPGSGPGGQAPTPGPADQTGRTPPSEWAAAAKQLRDVAQWMLGGVIAAAAGVIAATSLSKVGELDPVRDEGRIVVLVAGLAIGLFAMTRTFLAGVEVIAPSGGSLPKLARARTPDCLAEARAYLYDLNNTFEGLYPLGELLKAPRSKASQKYLPQFWACAPFAIVRTRFSRLLRTLAWAVPAAIVGFGLFAWAANPPDRQAEARPAVEMKVYR